MRLVTMGEKEEEDIYIERESIGYNTPQGLKEHVKYLQRGASTATEGAWLNENTFSLTSPHHVTIT